MTSPLLLSVAVALLTTVSASLWASFVATGMAPETERTERRDIRTW